MYEELTGRGITRVTFSSECGVASPHPQIFFQCTSTAGGYNACLLFADLEKVQDMVVREMAVICRCTEVDLASPLQCLGLDGDDSSMVP